MKPLWLKFKGINSFSEEVEIDFEPLTKAGLFGIFGDTGSGKSTILDAINFALFGDVNRILSGVEFINTKCNECTADFRFKVNDGGSYKEYEITRRMTRDKKVRNNKGLHKVELYQRREDGKLYVLANSSTSVGSLIPQILGVCEDDFRMCIALPQGQFAEFLNAKPPERADLIQRLFDLSRYGQPLADKISAKAKEANDTYISLQSKLDTYTDVTKEALETACRELQDAAAKRIKVQAEQKDLQQKINGLQDLEGHHTELVQAETELQKLSAKAEEMDSLRRDLSALPACRNVASYRAKANTYNEDIAVLKAGSLDLDGKISKADTGIRKCKEMLETGDYDAKIQHFTELKARYDACKDVPGSLKTHQNTLKGLEKELADAAAKETKLSAQLAKDLEQAKKDREACDSYKGDDISSLVSDDLKDAILKAGYKDFNAFLSSLSAKIQPYESAESALYALVKGEISAEADYLLGKIRDIPEGALDLDGLVKRIQSVQDAKTELQSKANASERKADNTRSALERAKQDAKHSQDSIQTEKGQIQELLQRLKDAYGDRTDYDACRREASAGLANAQTEKTKYTKAAEEYTKQFNDLTAKKEGVKASIIEKSRALYSLEGDILEAVSLAGKETEQECLDIVKKYRAFPDAEDTLKKYDDNVTVFTTQREKLLAMPGVKDFDKSVLDKAVEDKKALDATYDGLTTIISISDQRANDLREKLVKKHELEADFTKADRDKALIDELKGLIGSTKFLTFVAEAYLSDISTDASDMLTKLSKGQFWLEYKDKQFIVHDNFDSGAPRSVSTLSGGETFLVSLSLALSLSKITSGQSDKMIEFFFLDEGFGSLDTKLCDEVVDALETVRANYPDFTIGVISHVEELMQRIENKILVEKATETHGSTIRTTY